MADIIIRGLDAKTVEKLKKRARSHGRSLQSEARRILENAAGLSAAESTALLKRWRQAFAGRSMRDSASLLREDRGR